MKIHIVTSQLNTDKILPRLAKELAASTGWTLSDKPDDNADLNYFLVYLEYPKDGYTKTKTAALFSHKEENDKHKSSEWVRVAKAVDVRLTWADIYLDDLLSYGESYKVIPPLDRTKFNISKSIKAKNFKPIIGTNGYTYKTGRKGESLFKLLSKELDTQADFMTSGKGFNVNNVEFDWSDVQLFYHDLDIYVSTSLIEGIGYGVLEALASGLPVVIPNGVGIYDEIPEHKYIYRYEKGDYKSLFEATVKCMTALEWGLVTDEVKHELRNLTKPYTSQAWANSHTCIFENLLYNSNYIEPSNGARGIYTVAYGEQARDCAIRLVKSVNEFLPEIPICVVSDKPLDTKDKYIFIPYPDKDIGARNNKTLIYQLTPRDWEYILYLDADTEVVSSDVRFLFDVLKDGFEFVICTNPAQYVLVRNMIRPDNKDEMKELIELLGTDELIQVNGGVFSFRRTPNTEYLMNTWNTEWNKYGKRDQAALDRTLYRKPLRMLVLGNEWNTITRYIPEERTAGILHYPMQARRWQGQIKGRLDGSEAWASLHPERKKENENN